MGLTVADLSAKLGLDSSVFDRGISGVLGKFGPISAAGIGTGLVVGGALAGIGIAAVKMGAEFDDAYDTIQLGTGATGAKLDGLKDTFKQVVTDVPASFGDASAAITGLNQRLSITGPRLRELSGQFLELSRITKTDVAEDVRLGTRLFGDWSIKTSAQAGALDQLYRATTQSGIGLSDLMATVVQFGAPLRNMGFSFADSVGMLSKWEKEGVNITTVLTGMKFALKNFAKEGIDPARGFAKAVDEIAKAKTRAEAMKIGSGIFGLRGASDTVAAIREGRFQYQKFADTIANGRGTIRGAAEDTEDFSEAWTEFYNTLKVKGEPALTGIFQGLTNVMKHPFSRVTGLFDASDDEKAISGLEAHLAKLRAKFAERMAMGDFTGAAEIRAAIDRIEGRLGILRDNFRTPMAVGHVKNGLWIKGIDQAISREQYLRGIMKTPMATGHVKNAFWLSGINQGVTRAQFFKSLLATPMAVGHLNTSGWTSGISIAAQQLANFRSMVQTPMAVMHVQTVYSSSGSSGPPRHALGGVFRSPHIGLVAEAGPEAIIPLSNPRRAAQVMAEAGLSGGRGGTNIAVNVNAPVSGVDHLHEVIYSATMAAMEEAQVAEGRSARGSIR